MKLAVEICQGHPTTVSSLIRWKHFWGFPEYFKISRDAFLAALKHLYLFCHPGGTWVFSKLQGLQYYFPENLRSNLTYYVAWAQATYYESERFSHSSLHHIFESKKFRIRFLSEKYPNLGSEMWKIKGSENRREFMR